MFRRPIDLLQALVVLVLLLMALALAAAGRLPNPRDVLLFQGLLAAGVYAVLFVVSRTQHTALGRLLADTYSILVVPQVFNGLQPLITGLALPNQDAALVRIDRWLLAGRDAAALTAPYIRPWLSDLLFLAYGSFFLFPLAVAVPIWFRSRERYRRFVFAVVLAFYVSYAGYFLVPARGPRYYQWPAEDVRTRVTAISRFVYDNLNNLEYTKDDVFPSGHVMVTTVCLLGAWRFDRRLFGALLPVGLALAAATIYCRYHYVVDILAGFALACVTQPAAYRLYDWCAGRLSGTARSAAASSAGSLAAGNDAGSLAVAVTSTESAGPG